MTRDLKGMTATALALGFCLCGDATAQCGDPKAGSCLEPHPTPFCDNSTCCELVCDFEPFCCNNEWDPFCVEIALDPQVGCGIYVYKCPGNSSAPTNNCPTSPILIEANGVVVFDNTLADTVGPRVDCGSAKNDLQIHKDLWYQFTAASDGHAVISTCQTADFDTKIAIYQVDQVPIMPEALPDSLLDCNEDGSGCANYTSLLTTNVYQGITYLVRVGGYVSEQSGSGVISFKLPAAIVFDSGSPRPILINGVLDYPSISSGDLAPEFPHQWVAAPFVVPLSGNPGYHDWHVSTISATGFSSPNSFNETMEWVIWRRDAATNAAPADGDQIASGSVPFPTPSDDPAGEPLNEIHEIVTDFVLAPGTYYLTVYAANTTGQVANFAWFCNAPDGISLVDAQGPFCWRSAFQPDPGFQRYTLPANFRQQDGLDPNEIYTFSFKILGTPQLNEDCDFNGILDVDDLDAGAADCNGNSILDACEFGAIAFRSPFGGSTPLSRLFAGLNPSFKDVSITIEFLGDFDSPTEFVTLRLDGQSFGVFAVLDGPGCDDAPLSVDVTIPAATYNDLAADGQVEVVLEASSTASPSECENAFARVVLPIHLVAADCDGSGQPDACEIAAGILEDCDANGIPDICDASAPDCDANGRPDTCDIAEGTLEDCDSNGIPDVCDASAPDCDANGRSDACDIADGTLEDCDTNGMPDLCQLLRSPSLDCDEDERLDGCQIAENPGLDKNSDGVLDSCSLAFGDFNLDGVVDNTDLAVLLSLWGQVNSPIGDLNSDGLVDGEDLGILLVHWGPVF